MSSDGLASFAAPACQFDWPEAVVSAIDVQLAPPPEITDPY
ncbi:MAG: hypothetical protein RLO80_07920 [Hyphomonas sp.]